MSPFCGCIYPINNNVPEKVQRPHYPWKLFHFRFIPFAEVANIEDPDLSPSSIPIFPTETLFWTKSGTIEQAGLHAVRKRPAGFYQEPGAGWKIVLLSASILLPYCTGYIFHEQSQIVAIYCGDGYTWYLPRCFSAGFETGRFCLGFSPVSITFLPNHSPYRLSASYCRWQRHEPNCRVMRGKPQSFGCFLLTPLWMRGNWRNTP